MLKNIVRTNIFKDISVKRFLRGLNTLHFSSFNSIIRDNKEKDYEDSI